MNTQNHISQDQRNRFGLTERDMNTLGNIFLNFPQVLQLVIFGSRAKGNYKRGSDIDIAIMNAGIDEDILRKIKSDLEESDLPYKTDLVNFPTLTNKEFIDHIKRVGIPFLFQN